MPFRISKFFLEWLPTFFYKENFFWIFLCVSGAKLSIWCLRYFFFHQFKHLKIMTNLFESTQGNIQILREQQIIDLYPLKIYRVIEWYSGRLYQPKLILKFIKTYLFCLSNASTVICVEIAKFFAIFCFSLCCYLIPL